MYPDKKLTITGLGIVGAFEIYFAWKEAEALGKQVRVTAYEKNPNISGTTTSNIFPSLTADEAMSVIPPATELLNRLQIPFNQSQGIRVDIPGVNNSDVTKRFIEGVKKATKNLQEVEEREKAFLQFGKLGMELWKKIYEEADTKLKKILDESNFHSCYEPKNPEKKAMYEGYRIDLLYGYENADEAVAKLVAEQKSIGYQYCQKLSPDEVMALDPTLTDFCRKYSSENDSGLRVWHKQASAAWRPGGCIDTHVFLPKFIKYLRKKLGTYINEDGEKRDCLQIRYNREVTGLTFFKNSNSSVQIDKLKYFDQKEKKVLVNKAPHRYEEEFFAFCPGENVGTLSRLGLVEPPYAGFAGPSLILTIDVPEHLLSEVPNHYMEVKKPGVVLAWQAHPTDNSKKKLTIGVGGTKAFHGNVEPKVDEPFAVYNNVLQLNMINQVLPKFISHALGRNTHGQELTFADLIALKSSRWVGLRSVYSDGLPIVGEVVVSTEAANVVKSHVVEKAHVVTGLGSGGTSIGPLAALAGQNPSGFTFFSPKQEKEIQAFVETHCSSSRFNRYGIRSTHLTHSRL